MIVVTAADTGPRAAGDDAFAGCNPAAVVDLGRALLPQSSGAGQAAQSTEPRPSAAAARSKCNLYRRIAWTLVAFVTLPLLLVFAPATHWLSHVNEPWRIPCASTDKVPVITDVYILHSYWSEQRRDFAPSLCRWLKQYGGPAASAACTLFPSFWASAATPDQIWDLVERRIVAPRIHERPQGWLTRMLYWLGTSGSAPLFDEQEHVINYSYLGTAASHLLAVQNWTMELSRQGVPLSERVNRHLLVFEDDAMVSRGGMEALRQVLPKLDKCYDVLAMDSFDAFCRTERWRDTLLGLVLPQEWLQKPRLVPARVQYSRNTAYLVSYKGAMHLLANLPVTREIDLWFRDLMTDKELSIYVSCPRIVGTKGLPTVV